MSKLIMMVGFPGSGKSTYARRLKNDSDDIMIHSSDCIREELYGNEEVQTDPEKVFNILHRRTIIDLQHCKDVIYDATNLKAEDRARALQKITSHHPDIEKIALFMDTDLNLCKIYNRTRKRIVPESAYKKMERTFTMPTLDEGFDKIVKVDPKWIEGMLDSQIKLMDKNREDIEFTGVFFDRDEIYSFLSKNFDDLKLANDVLYPHVTFLYMPQMIKKELFGERVSFNIVRYGNDGLNEGFYVEWLSGPQEIKELFKKIPVPHITLSYGVYGKAVNTRYLDFKVIAPYRIEGIYGGLTFDGELKTSYK